jgi:hypothetical protein
MNYRKNITTQTKRKRYYKHIALADIFQIKRFLKKYNIVITYHFVRGDFFILNLPTAHITTIVVNAASKLREVLWKGNDDEHMDWLCGIK